MIFMALYFLKMLYILSKLVAFLIIIAHFVVIESKNLDIYIKNARNFSIQNSTKINRVRW